MTDGRNISPFEIFLRRLTNISGNNQMIFLPKLRKGKHIDFQRLSFLKGISSFQMLEKIIQEKGVSISPLADPRMPQANELSRELKLLKRSADFLFEEGGTKDLHLGWPFVRGRFSDGTNVNSPLLVFPMELKATDKEWKLEPREGANISFNKSFLYALANYNGTPLAESLLEEDFEDIERDSTVFRTAIYTMLQREKLEVHFNTDTYRDELEPYPIYNADEFEKNHKPGQLKLFPNAVLGIFPQADSYLVPDYIQLINNHKDQSLEEFFNSRSVQNDNTQKNFIGTVSEDKLYDPFDADSFQENILKASKLGHSLVVQGPPGTGKSQLICNLIADALATKKNVLVVCQKRAALDVVWQRMHQAGFGNFLALVHDFRNDRREIYSRIASQIESINEFKAKINSVDAIQLERNFLQASHRIDLITEELEKFKSALFDIEDCGVSAKELYLETDIHSKIIISVKQDFSQFRMDDLDSFSSKVKNLGHYTSILEQQENPWRMRKPFIKMSISALAEIKATVGDVPVLMQTISEKIKSITGFPLDYQQAEIFSNRLEDLRLLKSVLAEEKVFGYMAAMSEEREGETDTLWLQNLQRVTDDFFLNDGPEVSLENAQLGKFQQALNRSIKAKGNLFSWIRWELFSEDKFLVKRVLVANNLVGRIGLKTLERKLDARLNLEHNITKLREKSWIKDIPKDYSREALNLWFEKMVLASRCNNLCDEIRNLKNFLSPHKHSNAEFISKLTILIDCMQEFLNHHNKWNQYLHPLQMQALGTDFSQAPTYVKFLEDHFDTLCEHDDLFDSLSSKEKEIYERLVDACQFKLNGDLLAKILRNSLGLAWLEHMELKHPELRMVSSGKLEQLEKELQENIERKASLSAELVLLRARERTNENLDYNRLNNLTTYRDLLHEATKKKKIWPLRKLIATYRDELFKVMPVWLVSPESASALFPLDQVFDCVIFDEASQCFAERGIPAMARAKQVVVAGDKMQLKPGDFFQSRWDEDGETADSEVESLLDLATRHCLSLTLQGHYRSQSPALVSFSNKHFYDDRLQLIPHRDKVNSAEPAIDYVRVDGVWEDQSNEAEALKVAELVDHLSTKEPIKTIGVITFSQIQQQLVLDKVEDFFLQSGKQIPSNLFVKNIENVQGDERDIIIFSIGYAPDAKGKLSAQFGSLNMSGGENRLNVAITRAREKVIVVTSIMPEQLKVGETKNLGPKLFKEYLHFAHQISEGQSMVKSIENKQMPTRLKYQLNFKEDQAAFNLFPNADIVLKNENGFGQIILTDDENYEQSLSAKHHHALLPKILEDKGWFYQSAYSRNFWKDKDRVRRLLGVNK